VHADSGGARGGNSRIGYDGVHARGLDNRLQVIIIDARRAHDHAPRHAVELDQRDRGRELIVGRKENAAIGEGAAVSGQATACQ
jgi:hypothetical protein